jgi:hypothetical protein
MAVHIAWLSSLMPGHGSNQMLDWDFFLLGLAIALLLYFLPSFKAWHRCHGKYRWCLKLFFINLFLGWTIIGWWHVWTRANWSGPIIFAGRCKHRPQPVPHKALRRFHH